VCGFEVWQWVGALTLSTMLAVGAGVFGVLWVRGEKIERAVDCTEQG
jgi:hypothetical protein